MIPALKGTGLVLQDISKHLMLLTLFLIGTNLDFARIRELGLKPVLHGVILWVILGTLWGGAVYFKLV